MATWQAAENTTVCLRTHPKKHKHNNPSITLIRKNISLFFGALKQIVEYVVRSPLRVWALELKCEGKRAVNSGLLGQGSLL